MATQGPQTFLKNEKYEQNSCPVEIDPYIYIYIAFTVLGTTDNIFYCTISNLHYNLPHVICHLLHVTQKYEGTVSPGKSALRGTVPGGSVVDGTVTGRTVSKGKLSWGKWCY